MSDEAKTILATIGSVIIAIFLALGIGMCFSGFRQTMYKIFNVVPENEYKEVVNNEKSLNAQIQEYTTQIDTLNIERTNLLGRIAELDLTNANQAKLLAEYQEKISRLNQKILDLTEKLKEISANVNNATIRFNSNYSMIFLAFFDADDNYMYHSGYHETRSLLTYDGNNIIEYLVNNSYTKFSENILKSLSRYETCLYSYDSYLISIDGSLTEMSVLNNRYDFTSDLNASTIVNFNDSQMTIDEFINQVDKSAVYQIESSFDYSVNAESKIDNVTLIFNIIKI